MVEKVSFHIILNILTQNFLNSYIIINSNYINIKYKLVKFLGEGSTGKVYLLGNNNSLNSNLIIKISNNECQEDLINETEIIINLFNSEKIKNESYPLYYGKFDNLNLTAVIYPFLGYYNLENIKKIKYNISFNFNQNIIIQLINQLISIKNLLHCDLKSSNIVINIVDNKYIVSIIDFGLIKLKSTQLNVVSTNYITSPESLLTLEIFKNKNLNELVYLDKHDYIGLFTVIINLFTNKSTWYIYMDYLVNSLKFNKNIMHKDDAIIIFTYMYYKFFHNSIDELNHLQLKNLIILIEESLPEIKLKKFINFDEFFDQYIMKNLNFLSFNLNYLIKFKIFLKKIINFNPYYRYEFNELLLDSFLQS